MSAGKYPGLTQQDVRLHVKEKAQVRSLVGSFSQILMLFHDLIKFSQLFISSKMQNGVNIPTNRNKLCELGTIPF